MHCDPDVTGPLQFGSEIVKGIMEQESQSVLNLYKPYRVLQRTSPSCAKPSGDPRAVLSLQVSRPGRECYISPLASDGRRAHMHRNEESCYGVNRKAEQARARPDLSSLQGIKPKRQRRQTS